MLFARHLRGGRDARAHPAAGGGAGGGAAPRRQRRRRAPARRAPLLLHRLHQQVRGAAELRTFHFTNFIYFIEFSFLQRIMRKGSKSLISEIYLILYYCEKTFFGAIYKLRIVPLNFWDIAC